MKKRVAHYSIDDVWKSFKWLIDNTPQSIFDMSIFGCLRDLHIKYSVRFTLYCIIHVGDYCFENIPLKYEKDFSDSSDWLRFGFHSSSDTPVRNTNDYKKDYYLFENKVNQLCMGKTDMLRLHSWIIRDDQVSFFKNAGVHTIMYPNTNEFDYDEDGRFVRNDVNFQRTDVWLEKAEQLNNESLLQKQCCVFTHEWCFEEQREKMEEAIRFHFNNGYNFI